MIHSEAERAELRAWAKKNPQKVVASRRQWEIDHPDEARAVWRAHAAVRSAVKRGTLIRPSLCQRCNQAGRRIEAAHHDYARPLDVTWLCPTCHRIEDIHNPKTRAPEAAEAAA